jgi:hypothetical protein
LFTTKIDGKTNLGPSYYVCKISFPVKHLMAYYAETDRFRPPNRLTLQITLMHALSFDFWKGRKGKVLICLLFHYLGR